MTRIYVAEIGFLRDRQRLAEKWHLLSAERQEDVLSHRMEEDCSRSAGAGLLLEYGLREQGFTLLAGVDGKRRVTLAKGPHGKPYLTETEELQFNLSHAGDYAAAVFSSDAVGIDIERIREAKQRLAQRCFTKEEYEFLEQAKKEEKDRVFTGLWTRKESYIKAVGKGMSLPLRDFSVLDGTLPFATWNEPTGYCLSVCAELMPEEKPVWVDLEKSI